MALLLPLLLLLKVRQRCVLGAAAAAMRRRQLLLMLLSSIVLRLPAPLHRPQAMLACAVRVVDMSAAQQPART
jgi:hypothetical protein